MPLFLDHGADRGVFGGQRCRVGGDLNRLRSLPDVKGEIDAGRLLHLELDVVGHRGLETGRHNPYLVDSWIQAGETVKPRGIGCHRARHIGCAIGDRYGRVWNRRAALIIHFAANLPTSLGG